MDLPRLDCDVEEKGTPCVGVFFRYTENNHVSSKGTRFVFQKRLSLLKRRSCPGCDVCYPMVDDVIQGVSDGDVEGFFEFSPKLKHNDVVQLVFIPGPTDWETGYLDSWHYKVVSAK